VILMDMITSMGMFRIMMTLTLVWYGDDEYDVAVGGCDAVIGDGDGEDDEDDDGCGYDGGDGDDDDGCDDDGVDDDDEEEEDGGDEGDEDAYDNNDNDGDDGEYVVDVYDDVVGYGVDEDDDDDAAYCYEYATGCVR